MEQFPPQEPNEKQKRWQEMAERIEQVVDAKGKHIDANIKEAVIALNLLGINTTQSCEGHIDEGTGGPYIDIESKDVEELEGKMRNTENEKEKESIAKEIERKNLEERKKIITHLDAFYKDRLSPFERRLVIQGLARGWGRLESQGVDLQKIEEEDVKRRNLEEYQKEMGEFSSFLKDEFFE